MKSKGIMAIVLSVLMTLMFSFTGGISFSTTYPYEDLPMMDVWFENNGDSTYINFFNLKPELNYRVTLLDEYRTLKDGPYPWNDSTMPFDDFVVSIEPTDIVILEYLPNDDVPLTLVEYVVSSIGVSEVNVNTDIITGYATAGDPIGVTVFVENPTDPENPIQYKRVCDTTGGVWTADFSTIGPPLMDGSLNDVLDLTTFSTGILVQTNSDWNSTVTNWWAPNPEFFVDPMLDIVSGWGWLGEVTIVVDYNSPEAQTFKVTPESENGSFESIALGVDIYPGQEIYISDYMIEHHMVVSNITIEWLNIETDQVLLTENPNGYVQLFVLSGTPPYDISLDAWADGFTDVNGEFLVDFSSTGPMPYNLTKDSWGFVRNYDGMNNATMYEWHASDFTTVPGDINNDGVLDKYDLKRLVAIVSGKITPTPEEQLASDVNGDGVINAMDIKELTKLIKTK